MSGVPTVFDYADDETYERDRRRWMEYRDNAERLLTDSTLQRPEDQQALRAAIEHADRMLEHCTASRVRRADFIRRGLIQPTRVDR